MNRLQLLTGMLEFQKGGLPFPSSKIQTSLFTYVCQLNVTLEYKLISFSVAEVDG